MRLSQGQLNLLEVCPRKFQHICLDQLGSLTPNEQQERLNWGNQFHLLMQQRELGLPIDALQQREALLHRSVQALITAAPDLFQPTAPQASDALLRQSEHRRTLQFEDYLLTVVYDLLILTPDHAQILDWKTYPRPTQRRSLERNWQTRLYPFVLAETTHYRPEDISMTYWFVKPNSDEERATPPQHLTFRYSTADYQRDRTDLTLLLQQLTQWRLTQQPFPQVDESKGYCSVCPFAIRCQRHSTPSDRSEELTLEEIEEVVL